MCLEKGTEVVLKFQGEIIYGLCDVKNKKIHNGYILCVCLLYLERQI